MAETQTRNFPKPLTKSGVFDSKFKSFEVTPTIGREYEDVNIVSQVLNAENADELLRDLAITVSERGVVFFRAQDNLTNDLQKQLVHRLGQVTNKPATSTLHIHPVLNNTNEFGVPDAEISTISSLARKKIYKKVEQPLDDRARASGNRRYDAAQWHSDIQFEPFPADYTSLRLTQLPSSGGDTLWASGYEIYDRFSRAYQKFFEGLTALYSGEGFIKAAEANPEYVKLYAKERGSPGNVGLDLKAVHPVVRTNPVTGWKSIFALGPFPKYINELNDVESEELLKKFRSVVTENHDLQVRFKWRNENDLAIWDNRSAFHTATFDYEGLGERFGNRAVGIGEAPYFDPDSKSRTEVLLAAREQAESDKAATAAAAAAAVNGVNSSGSRSEETEQQQQQHTVVSNGNVDSDGHGHGHVNGDKDGELNAAAVNGGEGKKHEHIVPVVDNNGKEATKGLSESETVSA